MVVLGPNENREGFTMSTVKTVTGYALTLIVILALVVGACGIETETPAAPQPAPPVEDPTTTDDLDEYDTEQMLDVYEATMSHVSDVIVDSLDPYELEAQCAWHEAQPQQSVDSFMLGVLDTMPDEIVYLITEKRMRADVRAEIDEACFFASIGQ